MSQKYAQFSLEPETKGSRTHFDLPCVAEHFLTTRNNPLREWFSVLPITAGLRAKHELYLKHANASTLETEGSRVPRQPVLGNETMSQTHHTNNNKILRTENIPGFLNKTA